MVSITCPGGKDTLESVMSPVLFDFQIMHTGGEGRGGGRAGHLIKAELATNIKKITWCNIYIFKNALMKT